MPWPSSIGIITSASSCRTWRRTAGRRTVQHIHDAFDANWCRENDVRYFYANQEALANNPGLAAAIEAGRLRPLRREGNSCVYELTEESVP